MRKSLWLVLAILVVSAGWATAAITDDLLIYLPYDQVWGLDTLDKSGHGYDGVLFTGNYNTVAEYGRLQPSPFSPLWGIGAGKFGASCFQAGLGGQTGNGNVGIMDTHIIDPNASADGPKNVTISFWVKRPTSVARTETSSWANIWSLDTTEVTPMDDEYDIDWWNWTGGLQYDLLHTRFEGQYLNAANRTLKLISSGGGAEERHAMGTPCPLGDPNGDGLWHHVIIEYHGDPNINDGTARQYYNVSVDGVAKDPNVYKAGQGWGHMPIHAFTVTAPQDLKGVGNRDYFDDVAVWTRILTPAEKAYIAANPVLPSELPTLPVPMPSEANLVAWYHFEEGTGTTTADLTRDFTPVAGTLLQGAAMAFDSTQLPRQIIPAQVGNYLVSGDPNVTVNGDGKYVSMGTNAKFNKPTLDYGFTITAWIKPSDLHLDTADQPWGTIACKGEQGALWAYCFGTKNGSLFTYIDFDGGFGGYASAAENTNQQFLTPGVWHHVAMVYEPNHAPSWSPTNQATWLTEDLGTKVKFYVDGSQLQNNSQPSMTKIGSLRDIDVMGPPRPFTISSANRPFRGGMDDVRVYKTALTAEEIFSMTFRQCGSYMTGDLNGDCVVNLDDFSVLATGWQTTYDITDLQHVATHWLSEGVVFPAY